MALSRIAAPLLLATTLCAQVVPSDHTTHILGTDSGIVRNDVSAPDTLGIPRVVWSHMVTVPKSSWLRLEYEGVLLSGSAALCVCVWSVGTSFPCLGTVYTGHNHNIFSAEFVPGTRGGRCVTTAGDGDVRVVDLIRGFQSARGRGDPRDRPGGRSPFRTRRFGFDDDNAADDGAARSLFAGRPTDPNEIGDVMGMKVRFVPGAPDVLLATHQDGRVRRFDLRLAPRATGDVVVDLSVQGGCSDLAFDPSSPSLFALGCDDPFVRIFDVRHLAETPAAGASSRRRARSPSEREHGDLIPVVAKYSPGRASSADGETALARAKDARRALSSAGAATATSKGAASSPCSSAR